MGLCGIVLPCAKTIVFVLLSLFGNNSTYVGHWLGSLGWLKERSLQVFLALYIPYIRVKYIFYAKSSINTCSPMISLCSLARSLSILI